MPFARPTLTDLKGRVLSDIAQAMRLPALLRFSAEGAFGRALAGLASGLYGYLDHIARQAVPVTAVDEALHAWGALKGVLPKAAAKATGTAVFPGTVGAVLPAGTLVVRPADGVSYRTTADATVAGGGTVSAPVEANEAGATGNASAGAVLVLGASVAGIASTGSAPAALTGGADEESQDAFRTRMLDAYQNPPQGGAKNDYEAWALAVPGVTRAWVAPNAMGAGTVLVRVMMDDANAAFGGFPQGTAGTAALEPRDASATGDLLAVADAIYPLRPATALVYAAAPTPSPINLTIFGLQSDTAAIRAEIATALRQVFRDMGEPGGTIYTNSLNAAIDSVPGVARFALLAPSSPVTVAAGQLPTLGTVTYT